MKIIANVPKPKTINPVDFHYTANFSEVRWCFRPFCHAHIQDRDTETGPVYYDAGEVPAEVLKDGRIAKYTKRPNTELSAHTACRVCGNVLFSAVTAQPVAQPAPVVVVHPLVAAARKRAEGCKALDEKNASANRAEQDAAKMDAYIAKNNAKPAPSAAAHKAEQEAKYSRIFSEDENGDVIPAMSRKEASASYTDSLHKIPTFNLHLLAEVVEKINKKAKKTGTKMCTVEYGDIETETRSHTVETEDGPREVKFSVTYQYVRIAGETPRIDGWDFICAMEHTAHGNIVTSAPGKTAPETAKNLKPNCDHCRVKTRRNDTFILQNQEGKQVQIGRNCLADFLGGRSPEELLWAVESLRKLLKACGDADEDGFNMGGGRPEYPLSVFLAYVVHSIAKHGWVSRSVAQNDKNKTSTATDAWQVWDMSNNPFTPPSKRYFPTEQEFETAKLAAEWALTLEGKSDYENNIKIIAKMGTIDPKRAGFGASIVSSYQRSMLDAKLAAAKPAKVPSEYQGVVGQKIEVKVLILANIGMESPWGSSTLYIMKDASGNIYKWSASNSSMEKGKEYTLRGTVKEHSEYKGKNQTVSEKQTVLTRCVSFTDEELVEANEALATAAKEKADKLAEAKAAKVAAKAAAKLASAK